MKTTFTRTLAGMLAAVLLLLTLVGCGKEKGEVVTYELSDGPGYDDLVETDELVLYTTNGSVPLDRRRIDLFNAIYDVDVELVVIPEEEYEERIINDLATGSGPDVLFLYEMYGTDISKAALNNNFLDLTNVLEEDPEFHFDDYLDGVFEACQYHGRQYVMPLSCEPSLVVSLSEKMEEIGFSWDNTDTMSDYLKNLAHLTPKAAKDPNFKQMFHTKNVFVRFLQISGIPVIDYENGEVLPDEKGFREFLEAYKSYFLYDYDENDPTMWHRPYGYDVLTAGKCVFWFPRDKQGFPLSLSVLKDESHEYVVQSIPGQTGESVGTVTGPVAISATSKNSLNAYKYIKFLLSETAQMDQYGTPDGMPILKEAIRESLLESPSGTRGPGGGVFFDYEVPALTEDEVERIMGQIESTTDYVMMISKPYYDIVYDTMLPFFKAEDSYKNCLEELRSKLTFYLSE
ncbi:MAG: carbohydrate ABC transporter substrate-binding protein [Ruminococcaceae bacterium]|nr:carbohydrate ABC transporter substrate-binding protein [Oscillospiraceae bacterium]